MITSLDNLWLIACAYPTFIVDEVHIFLHTKTVKYFSIANLK